MLVFFKNIPANTQKSDLVEIIGRVVKGGLFHRLFHLPGTIVDIALLKILDNEKNTVNVHGLVVIMPDEVGSMVINQLDRKVVNGRRVTVREYHIRSEQNDPRKSSGLLPQGIIDQRIGERRQHDLVQS